MYVSFRGGTLDEEEVSFRGRVRKNFIQGEYRPDNFFSEASEPVFLWGGGRC